jgi:hypothetical protein
MKLAKGGLWPYRDFSYEYPPLAYLLVFLPGLVHALLDLATLVQYRILFGLFVLPFDFAVFRRLQKFSALPGAGAYYVFLSSLLPFLLFDRMDVLIGFAVAMPFLGPRLDWRFSFYWAFGGAVKVVPYLLLPLRLLDFPAWDLKRTLRLALVPAIVLAFSAGSVAWLSGGGISFFSHHSNRGVQVESIAGNLLLFAKVNGLYAGGEVVSNFGAQHLAGMDWLTRAAKVFFWLGMGLTGLAIFWLGCLKRLDSLRATWLLLLTFISCGYVLSPQFLLWILPLSFPVAAALSPRRRHLFLGLFSLVIATTGLHFAYYWHYAHLNPLSVSLVLLRNLLLLSLLAYSWWALVMRRPST